jgi:hypothetical protein
VHNRDLHFATVPGGRGYSDRGGGSTDMRASRMRRLSIARLSVRGVASEYTSLSRAGTGVAALAPGERVIFETSSVWNPVIRVVDDDDGCRSIAQHACLYLDAGCSPRSLRFATPENQRFLFLFIAWRPDGCVCPVECRSRSLMNYSLHTCGGELHSNVGYHCSLPRLICHHAGWLQHWRRS